MGGIPTCQEKGSPENFGHTKTASSVPTTGRNFYEAPHLRPPWITTLVSCWSANQKLRPIGKRVQHADRQTGRIFPRREGVSLSLGWGARPKGRQRQRRELMVGGKKDNVGDVTGALDQTFEWAKISSGCHLLECLMLHILCWKGTNNRADFGDWIPFFLRIFPLSAKIGFLFTPFFEQHCCNNV